MDNNKKNIYVHYIIYFININYFYDVISGKMETSSVWLTIV